MASLSVAQFKALVGQVMKCEKPRPGYPTAAVLLKLSPPLFVDTDQGPAIRDRDTLCPVADLPALVWAMVDTLAPLTRPKEPPALNSLLLEHYHQAAQAADRFFRLCKEMSPDLRRDRVRRLIRELQAWRDKARNDFLDRPPDGTVRAVARALAGVYVRLVPQASDYLIARHLHRVLRAFAFRPPSLSTLRTYASQARSSF